MYFEIEIYQIDENHCVFDLVTLSPVVAQIQLASPAPQSQHPSRHREAESHDSAIVWINIQSKGPLAPPYSSSSSSPLQEMTICK